MRIAITGATGLLGRNLLFEIIKQNLKNLDDLEIIVLGRPQKSVPLEERLDYIIRNDGCDYIGISKDDAALIGAINKSIIPIAFDLTVDGLGILSDDFAKLKRKKIDYFFHVAALTDFRTDNSVGIKLNEINVGGTQRIISLIDRINVLQLVYIGSAYSCGGKTGEIDPGYINLNEQFRNPYEKTKLSAEIIIRNYGEAKKLKYKIFRPSTICGRLLEKPIGSVNKFDVFYGWAGFFLRHKIKMVSDRKALYDERIKIPIRITVNLAAGLNIIPADYAAKLLFYAVMRNGSDINYHLANSNEALHGSYIGWMFDSIGLTGYEFTKQEPIDKNEMEKIYYRTVGKIFTPYIISEPKYFNISNLKKTEKEIGSPFPVIDKRAFFSLMDYAKQKNFGIKL